jgi:hypothetical protein
MVHGFSSWLEVKGGSLMETCCFDLVEVDFVKFDPAGLWISVSVTWKNNTKREPCVETGDRATSDVILSPVSRRVISEEPKERVSEEQFELPITRNIRISHPRVFTCRTKFSKGC